MTSLTRWNPFKSMAPVDLAPEFNDFFRGFGLRPVWPAADLPDIRLDVTEDDKNYIVKADIPGVTKEDIDLSVEGNQIAISAEIKRESKNKEGERDICTERYYGKMYRAFTTPMDIESAKAQARYANGVLTLTLPKKSNGHSRKIAVN